MGKIYITGDTHGNFDRIFHFCEMNNTTKDDILIILGDVGINYYGNKTDLKTKKRLQDCLPITLFCIKGNHENYAGNIKSYNLKEFNDGLVYVEDNYPNLIFAKDGEIYEFNTKNGIKNTIVIGGAYSVDKYHRLSRGMKWFEDEQPSNGVKSYVKKQLNKVNWNIDIVLSHTSPLKYEPREWFLGFIEQDTVEKDTEIWLDEIHNNLRLNDNWYCGHYHGDKTIDRMIFMFQNIVELGG